MALVKVVSGYVEIPDHPRGPHDYVALGAQLEDAVSPVPMVVGEQAVEDTWLANALRGQANITHSVSDNVEKNTLAYHCVQHQKFTWLANALTQDDDPADVYVWIDYGIMHVPGVTAAVIQKYLSIIPDYGSQIMIPGCWPKGDVGREHPCWRFCGGLMAVPRPLVKIFARLAMGTAISQISQTRNVEWEVNTLARLEQSDQLPIKWYKADHDATMFTALS